MAHFKCQDPAHSCDSSSEGKLRKGCLFERHGGFCSIRIMAIPEHVAHLLCGCKLPHNETEDALLLQDDQLEQLQRDLYSAAMAAACVAYTRRRARSNKC